ncbi:adenylyltransferase/cytidyltransferase family protein [Candidatus Bathyarchaeota archaeon]|nr:adenylyltransferase/cytidyltransferase family protein [Candidatus Bathyarchaeota archaeon]MBS7612882.1 adenylyltransferase/cytidyltransferase family protein [Candidatus Bathyarchaeota archaeon]MBS7617174.1 adenylyltransferase/cytidyltransferase family protein [Candidatus Bathyarchaeota archaeon]
MGRTVLVGGVFDVIHPGHIELLKRAKSLAGEEGKLVVLIARDETVEKTRGKPPIIPEDARKFIVENLKPVDEAILGFKPPSIEKVLATVKPDVVVLGYDQEYLKKMLEEAVRRLGIKVEIVKMDKFKDYTPNSSSIIKQRIVEYFMERGI